jgi:predicted transcriptional regulator YheO
LGGRYSEKGAETLMNTYLTMKELKEALPEIPENSLKRYIQEHQEYLDFKKEHNRYKVHVSEIEKLKIIRQLYSAGLKKEEVNDKLEASGIPVTITYNVDESKSLVSVNHELTDMKKLVSFLVQQNEQSRLQQNKVKEQNKQLIHEVQELKGTIEEIRQTLVNENERETEIEALFRDSLLATQKSIEEVASSIEVKKNKGLWLLQIKDFFLRSIKLKKP